MKSYVTAGIAGVLIAITLFFVFNFLLNIATISGSSSLVLVRILYQC